MYGVGELLRHRRFRIVRRLLVVVGRIAIGAPVPLVGAGGGVEHDDAAVTVAVRGAAAYRRPRNLINGWGGGAQNFSVSFPVGRHSGTVRCAGVSRGSRRRGTPPRRAAA